MFQQLLLHFVALYIEKQAASAEFLHVCMQTRRVPSGEDLPASKVLIFCVRTEQCQYVLTAKSTQPAG